MFRRVFSRKRKTGSVPVYLSVYDLTPINDYAYWFGLGVYHSGVDVHGVEYTFGAHDFPTTGIFEVEPKQCRGFTYRKSIMIGRTDLSPTEVRELMEKLAEVYTGNAYNLITKNCNHFCNDACIRLTGKPIPNWINRLARIGLLCNCVLPAGLNTVKVQHHRAEDGICEEEEKKKKLRSNSSNSDTSSGLDSVTKDALWSPSPPQLLHPLLRHLPTIVEAPSANNSSRWLIAQSAREEDAPPPPPQLPDSASDPPPPPLFEGGDDFLRIEFDGWDNDDDDDDDEDEIDFGNIDDADRSDDEIGEEEDNRDREDNERERRRRRRDILRLRIRDFASRATNGRNRNGILDWSEILMGLEDNSIELRMEMSESDGYIGNPEDYVDAAGYEMLLQNLAESDGGGARRGAPPAARSAVAALETVEITPEGEGLVCAICKESVPVGEVARKLPCGHGYHGDCIVPWLDYRNSCIVCRSWVITAKPHHSMLLLPF